MNRLDSLIQEVTNDIENISKDGFELILIISTTSKEEEIFLTPIRKSGKYFLLGIVVRYTSEAIKLVQNLNQYFSFIFVDIEKKLSPIFIESESKQYTIDTRNIFHKIFDLVNDENKIFPFYPNSLTVNSVITNLEKFVINNNDLTVGVVGTGNIGFEISNHLVKCGVNVIGYNKTISKCMSIQECINSTKPSGVISKFVCQNNIIKLIIESDIILFCAATSECIVDIKYLNILRSKKLIIDVGKNNLSNELKQSLNNIKILSVENELLSFISKKIGQNNSNKKDESSNLLNKIIFNNQWYKLVENGDFAPQNSIIVDSLINTSMVYGMIDNQHNYSRLNYRNSKIILHAITNSNTR
jgi:hypothetical protein